MPHRRWQRLLVIALLVLPATLLSAVRANLWPDLISLPNGFQPEGIALGQGHTAYVGSLPTGAIYKINLRTGAGSILVPGQDGRMALGLTVDERTNYLFVAGAFTGKAFVYNAATGALVAEYQLTADPGALVNDVVVTDRAAYFTDSFLPVLYRLPLRPNGRLPAAGAVESIPLTGDFEYLPGGLNSNGIVATPDGSTLIIDHTEFGHIYRVNPGTGQARLITTVPLYPDGLVLRGHHLYVVNYFNHVQVLRLNHSLTAATDLGTITDPTFEQTATAALFGSSLYVVSARSETPPTPDTPYWITRVDRRP